MGGRLAAAVEGSSRIAMSSPRMLRVRKVLTFAHGNNVRQSPFFCRVPWGESPTHRPRRAYRRCLHSESAAARAGGRGAAGCVMPRLVLPKAVDVRIVEQGFFAS